MKLNQMKKTNCCGLVNNDSPNSFIDVHHSGKCNSPLSEEQAEELLNQCRKYIEQNCKYLSYKCLSNIVEVYDENHKLMISFYVDEEDDWKYGITTIEKAEELAVEFIKIYGRFKRGSCWILPEPIEIKEGTYGYSLYRDSKRIALITNRKEAFDFASQLAPIFIGEKGLISLGHGWYRSIVCVKPIPDDVLLKLSYYIHKNW